MRGSQRDPRLSKIRLKSADWTRGSEELHVEHVEGINTPLSQEQSGRLSQDGVDEEGAHRAKVTNLGERGLQLARAALAQTSCGLDSE